MSKRDVRWTMHLLKPPTEPDTERSEGSPESLSTPICSSWSYLLFTAGMCVRVCVEVNGIIWWTFKLLLKSICHWVSVPSLEISARMRRKLPNLPFENTEENRKNASPPTDTREISYFLRNTRANGNNRKVLPPLCDALLPLVQACSLSRAALWLRFLKGCQGRLYWYCK